MSTRLHAALFRVTSPALPVCTPLGTKLLCCACMDDLSIHLAVVRLVFPLGRYPSSVKLLRSYGRFLEEVKNDPWTAARYFR